MIMIDFNISIKGLADIEKLLDPKIYRKAAARALNDTAKGIRTEAGKAIRSKFNLKAGRVSKEIRRIRVAQTTDLTAIIRAEGRPIGLMNFNPKWVRNVNGLSRTTTSTRSTTGKRQSSNTGITVNILKGKKTYLPHAFFGRGRRGKIDGGGSVMVFQRSNLNDNNSHLINKAVITIASMIEQEHVRKEIDRAAAERWAKRFIHHADRLT